MNEGTLALLIFSFLIAIFGLGLFFIHLLFSKAGKVHNDYYSGEVKEDNNSPRFFLISVLFVIFVVQAAMMFPWAIIFKNVVSIGLGWQMLFWMGAFLLMIAFSLFYVWSRGAFDVSKQGEV